MQNTWRRSATSFFFVPNFWVKILCNLIFCMDSGISPNLWDLQPTRGNVVRTTSMWWRIFPKRIVTCYFLMSDRSFYNSPSLSGKAITFHKRFTAIISLNSVRQSFNYLLISSKSVSMSTCNKYSVNFRKVGKFHFIALRQ